MTPTRSALLLACVAACEGFDNAPAPRTQTFAEEVQAIAQRMHERYRSAMAIQTALAVGNLDVARANARAVESLDEPDAVAQWVPYIDAVRRASHRVSIATGLDSAAEATAQLGRECARCHEAISANVRFPSPPRPERARGSDNMAAHQWAAARMWEGLIGPNDARWRTGAEDLTQMPSAMLARATRDPRDDVDDVARVKLFARRALTTPGQDDRAELYGRMLATCAHCHAQLRDR